jgi:alginate production protein
MARTRPLIAFALLAAAAGAPPLAAGATYRSSIAALRVGHWIEVRGALAPGGGFVGEEVELLQPQDDSVLIGTVPPEATDPRRFRLLGVAVVTDEETRWRGVEPGQLAGVRVKIEGRLRGDGSLAASAVSARGAGRDRIGGRIDELRAEGPVVFARLVGVEVRLPSSFEHEERLDAIAEQPAPASQYRAAPRDEEDQFGDGVALGPTLRLTGQLEANGETEREVDLDSTEEAEREVAALRARLRLDWESPGGRLSAALEARGAQEWTFADAGDTSHGDASLGEAYLAWELIAGGALELVAGRQDFDDEREWIYDENLDAVRLFAEGERVRFELAAGTTLFDGSPREEETTTYLAYLANADRKRRVAAWAMLRDADLAVPEKTGHLGVRAGGRWLPGTESWLELALFRGERETAAGTVDLEGWGIDVGLTAKPDWLEPFYLAVGYARGSGGEVTAARDETFRQTGLQDNNARFGGVTSFKYYGELFDPELANLRVLTAAVGVRFFEKSSLDLVWHAYEQDSARRRLIDAGIDRRADGRHAELGWEADLVYGARELPWLDVEIVAARFEPGAAFPADAPAASFGKLQVRIRF